MIAHSSMLPASPIVVGRPAEVAHLLEQYREESAAEVRRVFGDVSGKKINAAAVPGCARQSLSRAMSGCETSPVYRLVSWFVLARRLGIPKERLQRLLDRLQEALDWVYDDAPKVPLQEVLEKEQDLDGVDDPHQLRAAYGDREALRRFLDVKRAQFAHDRQVIARVRAEVSITL